MDLLLQTTGQASSGRNSVSGKQGETATSSDFARLLARQSGGSMETHPDNELSSVNDPRDDHLEGPDRNSTVKERSGNEAPTGTDRSNGVQAEQKEQEAPLPSLPDATGSFADASLAWASMPGFPASIELMGILDFTNPAVSGTEVIPADVRARLAGDIASQFTNRNGMQTLTLQLEPDHLGKVEVRMLAKGDQLSVRLLAENREAETALRHNLKELTDAIQEKTGKYQQIDVRVELKAQDESGAKNTGQKTPNDDARQHAGDDSQGSSRDDPEPEKGGGNPVHHNSEAAPDQSAQGG